MNETGEKNLNSQLQLKNAKAQFRYKAAATCSEQLEANNHDK